MRSAHKQSDDSLLTLQEDSRLQFGLLLQLLHLRFQDAVFLSTESTYYITKRISFANRRYFTSLSHYTFALPILKVKQMYMYGIIKLA